MKTYGIYDDTDTLQGITLGSNAFEALKAFMEDQEMNIKEIEKYYGQVRVIRLPQPQSK